MPLFNSTAPVLTIVELQGDINIKQKILKMPLINEHTKRKRTATASNAITVRSTKIRDRLPHALTAYDNRSLLLIAVVALYCCATPQSTCFTSSTDFMAVMLEMTFCSSPAECTENTIEQVTISSTQSDCMCVMDNFI